MTSVWEYTQSAGQVASPTYPLTSNATGLAGTCNARRTSPALVKTQASDRYLHSIAQMMLTLQQGPIAIALAGGSPCFQSYKSGVLDCACPSGWDTLDHAVTLVGWSDGSWILKNSWGEDWGENGYVRLPITNYPGACGMLLAVLQPPDVFRWS